MFFGEWSLAVGFNATDDFMKRWGDSQKRAYSKSAGWIVSPPRLAQQGPLMTGPPLVLEL